MQVIHTIEEMHEMSKDELASYKSEIWRHWQKVDAIINYMAKIGQPKLLPSPSDVEFTEEEE